MPKMIPAARAVIVLNRALDTDRATVTRLMNIGVPCNDALVADPMIQTANAMSAGDTQVPILTPLGLIAALFGPAESGRGYIGVLSDAGGIVRFVELDDHGRVL